MTRPPIHDRFTPLQRALHWLMAICILAMLFIGVGMVSTVRPDYLTLVSIPQAAGHRDSGAGADSPRCRLRDRRAAVAGSMPEPMKLAAHLSHLAFYLLMIGLPLIGWGMLSAADYPVVVAGHLLPPILPHSAVCTRCCGTRTLALCSLR